MHLVKPIFVVSLSFGLLCATASAQSSSETIPPTEIGEDHVGKQVSVEGRVFQIAKTNAGIHLYFGADTTSAFQALIPTSALHKFNVDPNKAYDKRTIRVKGKVETEKGKFFVRVTEKKQVKVVPRKRRKRTSDL